MYTILFPSSYIRKDQVDPDLENEAKAVKKTAGLQLAIFDYEQWFVSKKIIFTESPKEKITTAIYRGWMLKPEDYHSLYIGLSKMDIHLLTTPDEYNRMHLFPSAYPLIKEDTAPTLSFKPDEVVDIKRITDVFPRFMVKDDVKAVKGSKFPAFFKKDITQKEFDDYLNIFYKIRGESLTGGLCVKEYLDLLEDDKGRTNEYRAFYLKGELITLSPDSGQNLPDSLPPKELLEKYASLPSPFYTLDFAEKKEGGWIILETGDGQVSRLSPDQKEDLFYEQLSRGLNKEG